MVIKPLQVCALVTIDGSTLTVMGTLAVPSVTPLLGLTVNHGRRANPRPSRTLGLSVVWKLKMSEEGVQFISGLIDTFKVTVMALFDVEAPVAPTKGQRPHVHLFSMVSSTLEPLRPGRQSSRSLLF